MYTLHRIFVLNNQRFSRISIEIQLQEQQTTSAWALVYLVTRSNIAKNLNT